MRTLHPFTQAAIAAALPAMAWILPAPWGPLATVAVALGLCAAPGMAPRATVRTAALTALPFWFFLLVLHDRRTALAIGLRLTTMIASFVWLVAILPPARLVEAMVAAGWPVHIAYLFTGTLSAVPVLKARAARLVEAQRCRGLATRGGIAARAFALRALALPLILSALHEVDERALALETRGLVAGARRTPLSPPADPPAGHALRWVLVALVVLSAAARLR